MIVSILHSSSAGQYFSLATMQHVKCTLTWLINIIFVQASSTFTYPFIAEVFVSTMCHFI